MATYQEALTALADPTRRRVFERLVSGPMSVAELAAGFPVSRPAVSQHLRVLKDAGLVIGRREGTRCIYQLDHAGLDALRSYLDRFWEQSARSLQGGGRENHTRDGRGEMEMTDLAGGRWYEVGVDGSECDWGHVVAWEPSTRLVLAWQIGADWKFDPQLVTEVEVRFVDLGANRTRVDLEHRDLDRFGDSADDIRAGLGSPGGWQGLLDAFKSVV